MLARFVLLCPSVSGLAASAPPAPSAAEQCAARGGSYAPSSLESRAPLSGLASSTILVWENGSANRVAGWTSEQNTELAGTGGLSGYPASTITDDFQVPSGVGELSFAACLWTTPEIPSAEMGVWANSGGAPQPPVSNPMLGAATTGQISSTTYVRNSSYCPDDFDLDFEGRLCLFSQSTTGGSLTLPAGTYRFSAIGVDAGSGRAFFANFSHTVPLPIGRIGLTYLNFRYWTGIGSLSGDSRNHNFAFRVTGQVITQAIPTVGTCGFVSSGVALAVSALWALRLRRCVLLPARFRARPKRHGSAARPVPPWAVVYPRELRLPPSQSRLLETISACWIRDPSTRRVSRRGFLARQSQGSRLHGKRGGLPALEPVPKRAPKTFSTSQAAESLTTG